MCVYVGQAWVASGWSSLLEVSVLGEARRMTTMVMVMEGVLVNGGRDMHEERRNGEVVDTGNRWNEDMAQTEGRSHSGAATVGTQATRRASHIGPNREMIQNCKTAKRAAQRTIYILYWKVVCCTHSVITHPHTK